MAAFSPRVHHLLLMWKTHKYTRAHTYTFRERRRRTDLLKSPESSIPPAYLTLDTFHPALASHSFWEALGSHFWQERERKRDTVLILLLSSLYKHLSHSVSLPPRLNHAASPPLLTDPLFTSELRNLRKSRLHREQRGGLFCVGDG